MFLLFLIWFLLKACQNHAIDKKSAKFVSFGVTEHEMYIAIRNKAASIAFSCILCFNNKADTKLYIQKV